MKYILPIIAAIVVMACKTTEVVKYEYRSTTMLGTRVLTVTQDSIVSSYSGRAEPTRSSRATTVEEWAKLQEASKGLKWSEIANLEAPTNRRSTDASPFGSIKISTKDSTYKSSSFDGYNSHQDLLPVMDLIKEIAQSARN